MASKNLFKSQLSGKRVAPPADTINNAGGRAYSMTTKHELAQLAATGMLGDTFYTSAEDQLNRVIAHAQNVEPEYIAKLAVYARESGKMKDMPALLAAVLFGQGEDRLLKAIFPRVIDNGRMLRNFVQIVRSGKVGRKSLGTTGKKLIQSWFDSRSEGAIFRDSVGNDPSLADVIKLAHVKPGNARRQALYRYIIGKEMSTEQIAALPEMVVDFEAFKAKRNAGGKQELVVPNVPFQMLTALPLTTHDWKQIAVNGGWHFVRMNLNTFQRHGVLEDKEVVKLLAAKLKDPAEIARAKVFPYQLLVAYMNAETSNKQLTNALQDALEAATKNVPAFDAPNGVLVFPDVSGSMSSAVSGDRGSATSKVTCIDIAALVASTVLRQNPDAEVVPFDTRVHTAKLNPKDSIMTNASKLRAFGGGGTNCSLPLEAANMTKTKADLVIYVSDNESWVDANANNYYAFRATNTMAEWRKFKTRNPRAKMVNINIQPGYSNQTSNDPDILNIGGFSDDIFETIANFVSGTTKDWVSVVEKVEL